MCKQGLVRADQIKELFKKVMRTLKHSMIDLGLHARYKTMETEELYRTQTLDRLLIILNRTRNVQRARRDFRKIVPYMAMYDCEHSQLR